MSAPLPVVYLFGPTGNEDAEDLRHSLRSVTANLAHSEVWIVGHAPAWVDRDRVRVLEVPTTDLRQGATKHDVTTVSLRAACAEVGVDNFVLFNDDFFVMEQVATVPIWHRGPLADEIARIAARYSNSTWCNLHRATLRKLRGLGYTTPLSYELHVPMIVNRHLMGAALDSAAGTLLAKRTWYGNLAEIAGVYRPDDPKVKGPRARLIGGPFVSTNDASFKQSPAGRDIRARFTEPSPYELVPARVS